MDEATKELFLEICKIRRIVPKDSAESVITTGRWQQKWRNSIGRAFWPLYHGGYFGLHLNISYHEDIPRAE